MIVKNNTFQKDWHNATKPLKYFRKDLIFYPDQQKNQIKAHPEHRS
jgi:hypothetical protein